MKTCTICKKNLSLDSFETVNNKGQKPTKRGDCKSCNKAKRKAKVDASKEKNSVPNLSTKPKCQSPGMLVNQRRW